MSKPPRGLSPEEAALWAQVARTVRPIRPPRHGEGDHAKHGGGVPPSGEPLQGHTKPQQPSTAYGGPPPRSGEVFRSLNRHGLDGSWERKLAKAEIAPDFTIDLHGHSLEAAHRRLDHGLALALAQQARVVLVITGKPRPVDAADRGSKRGAIRAKLLDWLALGSHASRIAAVRPAQQRHGGPGAVYLVLKRIKA